MKSFRLARVAEVIRETASEAILFELKDPRVKMVTVTRAEVSADLQHAKVYVSIMGSEREQNLCMHGLRHAAGFIQAKVGKRMQTRYTPVIQFVQDEGVKNSLLVAKLLAAEKGATAGDAAVPAEPTGADDSNPTAPTPADGSAAVSGE